MTRSDHQPRQGFEPSLPQGADRHRNDSPASEKPQDSDRIKTRKSMRVRVDLRGYFVGILEKYSPFSGSVTMITRAFKSPDCPPRPGACPGCAGI